MDNFWKGKNVLVTGAFGFVGSQLCNKLYDLGAKVTGWVTSEPFKYADGEKGGHIFAFRRDSLNKDITTKVHNMVYDNMSNPQDWARILSETSDTGFDVIFNIAAQAIVTKANSNPYNTIRNNLDTVHAMLAGALSVHQNSKGLYPKAIVHASTDKVFGNQPVLPYTEEMSLLGDGPYDTSKVCGEILIRCYGKLGLPIVMSRMANIYGPGDYHTSRIVPGTILSVINNEIPVIRSDGTPLRDYLYIEDCIDGYLTIGEALHSKKINSGDVFNLSSNTPIRVIDLYKKILDACGKSDVQPKILNQASNEIQEQWINSDKIRKQLGWSSKVSLDDGIKNTVEWIKGVM